ncbi:MAG: GH92 family glycosyl hydrolase [Tannerella sp.]|jgi:predicted alpha-1,2-mannosidase|nr:GH92 family glycosyl hydrolase [Tannerella sp.]
MKKNFYFYVLPFVLAFSACTQTPTTTATEGRSTSLSQFVNPFVGVAYVGHTYPAAQLPFGMVQVGPDTGTDEWVHCSGYYNEDRSIIGFSHTHLSGTGCPDMGDVMLMPVVGDVSFDRGKEDNTSTGYRSAFSHDTEEAHPGYYKVMLDDYGIRAEMAATMRVGFHQYTYPQSEQAGIILDLGHGIGDTILESSVRWLDDVTLVGKRRSAGFVVDHTWYFCATFSKPVAGFVSFADGKTGTERELKGVVTKYWLKFATEKDEAVKVKVALSTVSEEGALKNLQAEAPDWDFEQVRTEAVRIWDTYLNAIEVEPVDNDQRISFYTSLYHALLMPNIITDVDGVYRLADGRLRPDNRKEKFMNFSLWDTYRAEHPFLGLLFPEMDARCVESMLQLYLDRGVLCTNDYGQNETWCMIGNHSVPVIVDAYLKGIVKDGRELAAEAIYSSLTRPHEKSNWEMYNHYGYYPFDLLDVESVSRTMEHCYDDYCAAKFFNWLGKTEEEAFFRKRSDYYKNLFDDETKLMRAKDSKGKWRTPFDKFLLSHAATSGGDYTEGNAWQYTWHVQHDVPALVDMLGGRKAFGDKLDSLFFLDTRSLGGGFHGDVTGMIGQYAHGNEPSHHVIYLYNYSETPQKTQELIRKVFDDFYFPTRDGLSGNDDCGQMSAWYIFSALGFYPVDPVSGDYIIGAPQVHAMTLHLPNGKLFEMKANGLSKENRYVKAIRLNGTPLTGFVITYDQVKDGGLLEFDMTDRP